MKDNRWIIGFVLACVLPLVALIVCLTPSGNKKNGRGSNDYQIAHIFDTCGNHVDVTIEKWYTHDDGVTIELPDGRFVYCPNGTYILSQDHCVICGER